MVFILALGEEGLDKLCIARSPFSTSRNTQPAFLLKELEDDQNLRFIDIYEDVQAGDITKQTYRGKDVYVQYLTYKPYGTSWGYVYDSRPCTEVRMARKINGHTLVAQYIGLDELTGIQEQDLEDILDRFWSWDDNPADSTETEP